MPSFPPTSTPHTNRPAIICALALTLTLLPSTSPTLAQTNTPAPPPDPTSTYATKAPDFADLEWVTRPSRDAVMSFTITAEIRELPVKAGQRVKEGDLLVRAREAEALAGLAVQRVRANNTAPVDSARANVDLAEVRYKRILEADAQGASNPQEIDERRVAVDAAKAALANAQKNLLEEAERLVQLQEQAKRYRIEAPFDGIVESIVMDVGQTVESPQPVLRIVNVDQLWIDLPVPTHQTITLNLAPNTPAWAMLDLPDTPVLKGRVLYVSPVADAAAETRRVRVELPNPTALPPGTRARVRFSPPSTNPTPTPAPITTNTPAEGRK